MTLTHSPSGHYAFLASSATFSSGAIADEGYGLTHTTFRRPLPLAEAFAAMHAHLTGLGQPLAAVCGIELRISQPLSFEGFAQLNAGYKALLIQHGLHQGGKAPAARTNVAPLPAVVAPKEPSVYAFTYTMPAKTTARNFIIAGAGEIRPAPASDVAQTVTSGLDQRDLIVRLGETTPDAMREKAAFCIETAQGELRGLGASWADASATNIYTAHPFDSFLTDVVLSTMGGAAIHGVHWFFCKPPIQAIEFEVDARNVAQEIMLG